jgi:hypothetical protein
MDRDDALQQVPVSEPLTVICTLWKGWQPIYDHQHVNALGRMVARYMPAARFVCFTNEPHNIQFETQPLPRGPRLPLAGKRNCFRRMWFFSREFATRFPGRIMNIDLDALIFRDLTPLVTDHDFRILFAKVCPYNGGFWTHRTGTRTKVWNDLNVNAVRLMHRDRVARKWVGSDQKWLAYKIPGEALYTYDDGTVYGHMPIRKPHDPGNPELKRFILEDSRIAFFPGPPTIKPWHPTVAAIWPELHAAYMEFFE